MAWPSGHEITLEGIEDLFKKVQQYEARITMPMKDQCHGTREFAFEGPVGCLATLAERIEK